MTHFVKVARTDEIKPGQARLVDARGRQIALFNINGEFFAIDNMCTHEQASLAEGEISGHEVTYGLENRDLLAKLRVGQTVRFDVEERSGGHKVLTAVF